MWRRMNSFWSFRAFTPQTHSVSLWNPLGFKDSSVQIL
jgi:hypothetical protein